MEVMLKNVRLSFPNLWKADKFDANATPRYGACFLLPKDSKQVKEIEAAIEEVGRARWEEKWDDKRFKSQLKVHAFRDGDARDYAGYEGHYYIVANRSETQGRPDIYDHRQHTITADDDVIYAGCFVNAIVDFWADGRYGNAINATLLAVQFWRDGEAFQGGPRRIKGDAFPMREDEEDEDIFA